MALSAKRLVSKTQRVTPAPAQSSATPPVTPPPSVLPSPPSGSALRTQPSALTPPPSALSATARQSAAKSEIDNLLQDLLKADGNGEISLNDTLIPQAAQAEAESGITWDVASDSLGGFILPEKQNAENLSREQTNPTVEISVPQQHEPTVKIPVPPPPAEPATVPVSKKSAKRKPETWTINTKKSEVEKDQQEKIPEPKPQHENKTAGQAEPASSTKNTKKNSSLPAVIVLIVLLLIAVYVVFTFIIPELTKSGKKDENGTVKSTEKSKPTYAELVSNSLEVVNAVKARNSADQTSYNEQPVQVTVIHQPAEVVSDSISEPSSPPQPQPKKKKKKEEEIIDIPFEDDELPPEYQPRPWPEISLTAVIAKGKKGDGFATVNGETLSVGDETSSGVKLISVAVNPPRAVFKFEGREQTVLVSNKGE